MDNFETYFTEVIIKKLLPSLVKGALAGLVALIAAHQGVLQALGVVYTPSVDQITLNLTTFSKWLLIVGGGGYHGFLHFTSASRHGYNSRHPANGDATNLRAEYGRPRS